MISRYLIFNICLCLIILGCKSNKKELTSEHIEEQLVDYFADNGFGNAVAIVQHPSGINHKGITYVCYQGSFEDPYVASYNHNTGEWKGPFKAEVSNVSSFS